MSLEAEGAAGPVLGLLGLDHPRLSGEPLRLRASGAGPLEALALRAEAELAEARLEWQTTLDFGARTGQGSFTLRHPGAARLLGRFTEGAALDWLGEGSLSVVAALAHRPGQWNVENLEFVAGAARARGQLGIAPGREGRPAATGRLAFERLPLPAPERWRFGAAGALDLALDLTAEQVAVPGLPALTAASAALRGDVAGLRLSDGRATLLAGEAQLEARIEPAGDTRRLRLDGGFEGVSLGGPVFGRPLDVTAGRMAGSFRLTAEGMDAASALRSLGGSAEITLRDGVVGGFDAPVAVAALGWEDVAAAEAALRRALGGGSTPVERGLLRMRVDQGTAWITDGELRGDAGLHLGVGGHFGLAEDGLALRLELPVPDGAPAAGLDILGQSRVPDRRPDITPFLRWRAEAPR
nr:AsmA family protein [Roseococcus suduntuyensis]